MIIYFKTMYGNSLIEKGEILTIGGQKKNWILTGNNKNRLELIGDYKNAEKTLEVFNAIVDKVVNPSLQEMQKGIIYIDLKHLSKIMEEEE